MAPPRPFLSRRRRGLAAAACATVLLPVGAVALAGPASAQTTTVTTTQRAAATSAAAVRLTINLPQGNTIVLEIDPVTGGVKAVTGSGPEATALATLITGSIAGQAQSFPGASAMLPEPKESAGPANAVGDAINGSPLGAFLNVQALSAGAAVTEAPDSTSRAQIAGLGVGLPQALNDALQQVLDPLVAALDQIIVGLGPLDGATQQLCAGIAPITVPVTGGVAGVPVLGPVLEDALNGTVDPEAGVVCNLRNFLAELQDELALSLDNLTGPGGLLGTGLIGATQSITTEGARTTAQASASIADLRVLGVNPFGEVAALQTTSTAVVDGATSDATVSTTAVEAFARPLLTIETDLRTVTGDLAGIDLAGLTEVLAKIQAVLDALAGIGIEAGPLGNPTATALEACPQELSGALSGTFEAPGSCAAAAARGFGLAVTLPAALATPLGIAGPLVSLQLSPSAAVVRGSTTTATRTEVPVAQQRGPLPRTGVEAPAAALGLALLVGAALLRRRTAVES